MVKGKNQPVEIYIPIDKKIPPFPGNLFPELRTHNYAYGFKKKIDFANQQIFGRDDQYKKV